MIVFRIEGPNGEGPYRNYISDETPDFVQYIREMSWKRDEYYDAHPLPNCDGCGSFQYCHHFGFKSYRQLRDWFFAPLKMIEETGYFIAVYEDVKDCVIGGRQVAFARTEKVTRLKPTEAYKQIRKNKKWNTATRLQ